MSDGIQIRTGRHQDVSACIHIYNHYVDNTVATFDTQPMNDERAERWFKSHQIAGHPLLVAEQDERIVGYGTLSRWSDKQAYGHTSEVSVFIRPLLERQGLGGALLDALIAAASLAGHRCLLARIEAGNRASVELFRSREFVSVGVMHDAGFKFGRWLDVEIMERLVVADAGS